MINICLSLMSRSVMKEKMVRVKHIAFATILMTISAHSANNLSGQVLDSVSGNPLKFVTVYLSKHSSMSALTEDDGKWNISYPDTSSASIFPNTFDKSHSKRSSISLDRGHITIDYSGYNPNGSLDRIKFKKVMNSRIATRASDEGYVDTLIYKWQGVIKNKTPIASYSRDSIIQKINTSMAPFDYSSWDSAQLVPINALPVTYSLFGCEHNWIKFLANKSKKYRVYIKTNSGFFHWRVTDSLLNVWVSHDEGYEYAGPTEWDGNYSGQLVVPEIDGYIYVEIWNIIGCSNAAYTAQVISD